MNVGELQELLLSLRRTGNESGEVEVKTARTDLPKSVKESLSAFANTRGGVILLGVDERQDFMPTGVDDAAKISADLASMCAMQLEPPLRPLIEVIEIDGRNVIVAEVSEIENRRKPCYVKAVGMNKGSYTRVNDADQALTSYEIHLMQTSTGQPRDDMELTPFATMNDLDGAAVDRYAKRLRVVRPSVFAEASDEEILSRTNVVRMEEHRLVPTVAGMLALGKYPQQFYPQLMLSFVSYPTADGAESDGIRFLDNVAVEGPIPTMVRDVMAVLRRNMSRRAIVSGAGRKDLWDYPETALREAVVNALVHRDLSSASHGAQVQIEMYPDRLVIRNPGGLHGPVQVENLGRDNLSSARNATLLRILEDVSMPDDDRTVCENRGSGIRAMIASLREYGMAVPKFKDSISAFTVTFPNHSLLDPQMLTWIGSLNELELTESQVLALARLREGGTLDNPSYRVLTGVDSRVATHELQDLVARELADQSGKSRWASYQLAERLNHVHDGRLKSGKLAPADRREEILNALGDDEMSRLMLVEKTGLGNQVVRHWLKTLRKEGFIRFSGTESPQSRNVKYRATEKKLHNMHDDTMLPFEL